MKKKKGKGVFSIFIPIIIVLVLVMILLLRANNSKKKSENSNLVNPNPVVMEGEKQIVNIIAKSGYSPREVTAKSGISTILKLTSDNAYGCERAFLIPSLKIEKTLPINGEETFNIGTFKSGEALFASCSMGMYTFEINFK